MKGWEVVADNFKKTEFSLGWSQLWISCASEAEQSELLTHIIATDGKRFVVHADEKLTAFLELESATRKYWQAS